MTTYAKPAKIPLWAMTTANILEPSAGKKNEGWDVDDVPPSSYENWRTKTVAQWFQWFDERFYDGPTPTPENSLLLKMDGIDSFLFTKNGAANMTDTFGFEDTGDFGTFWSATFAAILFDFLSQPNTGLYYDKVTDEFQFRIASSVDSFAVDGGGYLKIGNQPTSGNAPAFGMLDRRGADTSGKLWIWQVNGASAQYVLEQFTQGGSSEGNALAIDGSTVLKRWQFIANGTYGTVLEPTTDYLTNLAGFIGSPTKRWTEIHSRLNYEAEPPHGYWREDSTITIPNDTDTDIMPRFEILTQSMTVNDTTRRLTMPTEKGRYKLDFVLRMKSNTNGTNVLFKLLKNGTAEGAGAWTINAIDFPNSGEYTLIPLTFMVQVDNVSDYFQLQAYQNGGVGVTATVDEESRLTAVCVRKDP